jgi:hypothetical protein
MTRIIDEQTTQKQMDKKINDDWKKQLKENYRLSNTNLTKTWVNSDVKYDIHHNNMSLSQPNISTK